MQCGYGPGRGAMPDRPEQQWIHPQPLHRVRESPLRRWGFPAWVKLRRQKAQPRRGKALARLRWVVLAQRRLPARQLQLEVRQAPPAAWQRLAARQREARLRGELARELELEAPLGLRAALPPRPPVEAQPRRPNGAEQPRPQALWRLLGQPEAGMQ
jgi:hypothetical protein